LPFVRFSRDKRGVENFYLVQPTTNRRGKVRPRVLYWFRSPPDVKVGREPFDPFVRRTLEAQNPGVVFDWRAIVETPIPSADADKWRERRRAERAAKHAAAEEEALAEAANGETEPADTADLTAPAEPMITTADEAGASTTAAAPAAASSGGADMNRRRRRRRRNGGSGGNRGSAPNGPAPPASGEPSGD
jgi:hypothetical protein